MMRAENYIANVVAARFIKSLDGDLGVEIVFEYDQKKKDDFYRRPSPVKDRVSWVAWMGPKYVELSVKTLVNVLGFLEVGDVSESGIIPIERFRTPRASITVEEVEKFGKCYPRVKRVVLPEYNDFIFVDNHAAPGMNFAKAFEEAKNKYTKVNEFSDKDFDPRPYVSDDLVKEPEVDFKVPFAVYALLAVFVAGMAYLCYIQL